MDIPKINLVDVPEWAWIAAGLAVAYIVLRGTKAAAEDIAGGAVGAVEGTISGAVKGVAGVFGIPETDADKCQAALAAGKDYEASKYCPAGTFIGEQVESLFDWIKSATGRGAQSRPAVIIPTTKGTGGFISNQPGVIIEQQDCGISGLLCGPSFESEAGWWGSSVTPINPGYDASIDVLSGPGRVTSVAGLRG